MTYIIQANSIEKNYIVNNQKYEVLKSLDLDVLQGERLIITGSSGSGKSTLLNILGLLDKQSSGSLIFEGLDISLLKESDKNRIRESGIGFVFQSFYLQPYLDLKHNVALPLLFQGYNSREAIQKAINVLEKVGLKDKADFYPNQISGGQMQRVALARSIVTNPKIILADEPTGSLDKNTGLEIVELLVKLNREQGVTLIIVTHNPDLISYGTRHLEIIDGQFAKV